MAQRVLFLALGACVLAVAACGEPSDGDSTTATTTATSIPDTAGTTSGTSTTSTRGPVTTAEQMCDWLQELSNAGLRAPAAFNVMWEEALEDMTQAERQSFGQLLTTAADQTCSRFVGYAAEIRYWIP